MLLVLVNCLGGLSLPRNSVLKLTDHSVMTIAVYQRLLKSYNTTTLWDKIVNISFSFNHNSILTGLCMYIWLAGADISWEQNLIKTDSISYFDQ